jgi:hypothetical protein
MSLKYLIDLNDDYINNKQVGKIIRTLALFEEEIETWEMRACDFVSNNQIYEIINDQINCLVLSRNKIVNLLICEFDIVFSRDEK